MCSGVSYKCKLSRSVVCIVQSGILGRGRGGGGGGVGLFLGEKRTNHRSKKSRQGNQTKTIPSPPGTLRSGCTTIVLNIVFQPRLNITHLRPQMLSRSVSCMCTCSIAFCCSQRGQDVTSDASWTLWPYNN